jgi:hypothetical protein
MDKKPAVVKIITTYRANKTLGMEMTHPIYEPPFPILSKGFPTRLTRWFIIHGIHSSFRLVRLMCDTPWMARSPIFRKVMPTFKRFLTFVAHETSLMVFFGFTDRQNRITW